MNLKQIEVAGHKVWVRPDTSDEKVFIEVVTKASYRRKKAHFDVEPGEHWLDLGANVGAFALYCHTRGATCTSYEPDPNCYEILEKNVASFTKGKKSGFQLRQMAVTHLEKSATIALHVHSNRSNHSRNSCLELRGGRAVAVPHRWAGHPDIQREWWSGIKMDIEGSEFGILDKKLLPPTGKLVLEYHTSRDDDADRLASRIEYLNHTFPNVHYPPELDRLIAAGGSAKTFFDRLIHCIDDQHYKL
jgi:FkbM family methyltransferase